MDGWMDGWVDRDNVMVGHTQLKETFGRHLISSILFSIAIFP